MHKKQATVPKQQRSIKTRQLIKDTGYRLFSEKGLYGTSSNQIAAEAGVNIGTFYNYFVDKRVLFLELLEDFQERFVEKVFSAQPSDLGGIDVKTFIRQHLNQAFDAFRSERDFFKSAYPLQYMDEDVEKVFRKYERQELRMTLATYRKLFKSDNPKQTETTITVISMILIAASNRFYTLGMSVGKKQLIDTMVEMTSTYIEKLQKEVDSQQSVPTTTTT